MPEHADGAIPRFRSCQKAAALQTRSAHLLSIRRQQVFSFRLRKLVHASRLTGWVAENQQAIVNSEAKLDLGPEAAFVGLNYCVSLPLVSDGQLAGVLSLYAADPFRDEQIHTLQSVLPHLALMFLSLETRADSGIGIAPARQPLRVVSSR